MRYDVYIDLCVIIREKVKPPPHSWIKYVQVGSCWASCGNRNILMMACVSDRLQPTQTYIQDIAHVDTLGRTVQLSKSLIFFNKTNNYFTLYIQDWYDMEH